MAAGASLLIAASAAVTAPIQAAAVPVADDPVQVTIDSFSPSTPKPGDAVTITGKVTNKSSTTFENPQAIFCIDNKRLTTPEQLAAISTEEDVAGDDSSCAKRRLPSESTGYLPLGAPLTPQASAPFKLVVKWNEWGLTDQPGVYVVGVAFRGNPSDRQKDRDTAGQARTLMPVISKSAMPRQVRTALVLPLRHRPTMLSDRLFLNDSLAQSMAPTGQLGKLLELGKKQLVSWLVDPAMILEARRIAESDSYLVAAGSGKSKAGTGRAVVKAWLDAFDETRKRNPVVMLPFGDPNVASLTAAGEPVNQLVKDARTLSEGYPLGPPQAGNPSGLWLEGAAVNAQTLITGSFGFTGKRADDVNILSSSGWAANERPKLQPSPVYNVQTPDGPAPRYVRAVIADSDLLAGGPDPATATQPIQLQQRFFAQTSLLAGTGTGAATVVAVPPRSWMEDSRPIAAVQEAMAAPWITPVGINQVIDPHPRAVAAPAAPADAPGLNQGQLDKIKDLNKSIKTYQALLGVSAEIPPNMRQALVRTGSSQWEGFPDDAQRFVNYQANAASGLLKQVHLIRNNTKGHQQAIKVNLSGSKGSFPLTVENKLDVTVRVKLVVTSTGNRNDLRIQPLRVLVLSAGQKGTFLVKASAEQNGLINAKAQLVTAGGEPVGDPQPLVIQAAQYGSVGWILVGAAVALLFGTSIVRIYRRVRSERRNPTEPESEADALHPEPLTAEDLTPGPERDAAPATPEVPAPAASELESLKEGVGTKDG